MWSERNTTVAPALQAFIGSFAALVFTLRTWTVTLTLSFEGRWFRENYRNLHCTSLHCTDRWLEQNNCCYYQQVGTKTSGTSEAAHASPAVLTFRQISTSFCLLHVGVVMLNNPRVLLTLSILAVVDEMQALLHVCSPCTQTLFLTTSVAGISKCSKDPRCLCFRRVHGLIV